MVVTEIPYQVNKAKLIEKIAELVHEKKLDGISELRDESNREGMRIVIELKRDAIPQVVLNKLYKLTPMQSSFGIINIAIVDGQPKILNLKQILEAFVQFRRDVVRRRTQFELRKAQARAHILEGLNKAIDALDYIIPLIRNSRSVDEAKGWLTGNFATLHEVKNWRGVDTSKTLAGFLKDMEKVVELIVNDPWESNPEYGDPKMYADTAATVLEPVVNGVKLIVKTEDGYVGESGWFSGDEQYFANTLPGVTSQAAEVTYDLDGDGTIGDDEAAFLFPVQSKQDIELLDPIIKDQIGDYPTRFEVDPSPF